MAADARSHRPLGSKSRGTFCHFSRSWYYEANKAGLSSRKLIDDVSITVFDRDSNSPLPEIVIQWHRPFRPDERPMPQLTSFFESFSGLLQIQDLIEHLARPKNHAISPTHLCEVLQDLGFVNRTERERPG